MSVPSAHLRRSSSECRYIRRIPIAVVVLALATLMVVFARPAAAAKVDITIDLSQQQMRVSVLGQPTYRWPVSTARPGYRTPTGTFRPIRLERTWYSTIYDSAPMPYSIFFYGGYAIHGTTETSKLGRPVSHGCVRLHPENARTLFNLVSRHGAPNTTIRITR